MAAQPATELRTAIAIYNLFLASCVRMCVCMYAYMYIVYIILVFFLLFPFSP